MGKPIVHSYSSLKEFNGCPKKYWHSYVAKDVKREYSNTGPAAEGRKAHKAIENAMKYGETTLPKRYAHMEWLLEYYNNVFKWMKKTSGSDELRMYFERQMGVTKDYQAVTFFDRDVAYRGALDLMATCGDIGYIADLKTGNPSYADDTQLEQQAVLLFAQEPQVNTVVAQLMFTKLGPGGKHPRCYFYRDAATKQDKEKRLDLEELQDSLDIEMNRVDRLIATQDIDSFPPQENGLCKKYCDVLDCYYNGKSN